MFGIGMPELLVIAGLALLLIGPKKLPDLARSIGKTLGELRKAADDLKGTISEEINTIKDDIPNQAELQETLKKQFLGAEDKKEADKKEGTGSKKKRTAGKKKKPAG
jgi:Tat protein translocase TatB subunit